MKLGPKILIGCLSLAALTGALEAQIPRIRPVLTVGQVIQIPNGIKDLFNQTKSLKITLAAECNLAPFTSGPPHAQTTVYKQDGNVRFRMSGTAPAGAYLVTDQGVAVPFVNNGYTGPVSAGGGATVVADINLNPITTPIVLNGAAYPSGSYPTFQWNWPTGFSLWGPNRWAANKCNNVPVKPITVLDVKPWISEINRGLLVDVATTGGTLGTGGGVVNDPTKRN